MNLACKNRPRNDLSCVEWDVKPYTLTHSYRSNRLGLSHWDPYAVHRGSSLELYHCNMVQWFWWDSSLIQWSRQPAGFLQCFNTVSLVIWPGKIVPRMTYNMLSGALSLYTTTRTVLFHILLVFSLDFQAVAMLNYYSSLCTNHFISAIYCDAG